MVQPAASAAPALRVIMALGKFHGVIAAHTPTGCLITKPRIAPLFIGSVSPYTRRPCTNQHPATPAHRSVTVGFSSCGVHSTHSQRSLTSSANQLRKLLP